MELHYGVVEDRNDPEYMGRAKVRVVGIHTQNRQEVPTDDLPWSNVMMPTTSASTSGIGATPYFVEGSWVVVAFLDEYKQQMLILGTLPGKSGDYRSASVGFSSPSGSYPKETDTVDMPAASRPGDYANHPTMKARDGQRMGKVPQATPPKVATVAEPENDAYYERTEIEEPEVAASRQNDQYPLTYAEVHEGGHIIEYGNTSGEERYSYTHPTGSYQEVDGAGSWYTKSVGDQYEFSQKNREIVIKGDCNITVIGSMRHFVKGDYTLEVEGNYNQKIGKSIIQKVASNVQSEIGQDFAQTIGGSVSQNIKQNRTIMVVNGDDKLTVAAGSQWLTVKTDLNQTVNGKRTETTAGNKAEITVGSATYYGKANARLESTTNIDIKSNATIDMTGVGAVDINGETIDLN